MSTYAPNPAPLPYTTLFRSEARSHALLHRCRGDQIPEEVKRVRLAVRADHAVFREPERIPVVQIGIGTKAETRVQVHRARSEEHTSELHHLGISYAVFCLKK